MDRAVVGLHDGLTDGEAQTGPTALPSGIGAVEAIEDLGQVLRWDTGSRVGDDNLRVTIHTVKLQRYLSLFRRVLQGIVEQVKQQSPQALSIPANAAGSEIVRAQLNVFGLSQGSKMFRDVTDEVVELEFYKLGFVDPRIFPT